MNIAALIPLHTILAIRCWQMSLWALLLCGLIVGLLVGAVIAMRFVQWSHQRKFWFTVFAVGLIGLFSAYAAGRSNLFGCVPTKPCDCKGEGLTTGKHKPIILRTKVLDKFDRQYLRTHDSTKVLKIHATQGMTILAWWIDSAKMQWLETDPDGVSTANAMFMTVNASGMATPIFGPTIFIDNNSSLAPKNITSGTISGAAGWYGFGDGSLIGSYLTQTYALTPMERGGGTASPSIAIARYPGGNTALVPYFNDPLRLGQLDAVNQIILVSWPQYIDDPTPYQWQCTAPDPRDPTNTIMITVVAR